MKNTKFIGLNKYIAELIGLHTGDGTLYRTKYGVVWELRGNLNEKEFYDNHIKNLIKIIFNIELVPKYRSGGKNGCYGIQTSNKIITNFLIEYGFSPGRKTGTVSVPEYIKKGRYEEKCYFIRGLFDTDGCLRFDKINNRKVHDYPKIELQSASKKLRDDVTTLLAELGFKYYTWDSTYFAICLPGIRNLEKFMNEIRPKNPKYTYKYKIWNKLGHYPMQSVNFIK